MLIGPSLSPRMINALAKQPSAPGPGRMPDAAREDACEMTLVDEAAFERDVGKGLVTLAKQHHRALDTGLVKPSVGRHAGRITECSSKVAQRQAARRGDRCQRGRASEI